MNRNEFLGKLNALYVGDKNCLEELLTAYDEKDKEIERLKKREQECIDHYLVQCKYASEMEAKYISANYIINDLEKWLVEWREMLDCPDFYEEGIIDCINDTLEKLQELKGESNEEN